MLACLLVLSLFWFCLGRHDVETYRSALSGQEGAIFKSQRGWDLCFKFSKSVLLQCSLNLDVGTALYRIDCNDSFALCDSGFG